MAAGVALPGHRPAEPPTLVRLATTTSTDNSGLLQVLLPAFQRDTGYGVHTIAVGTGKALALARNGDVDVVLVHATAAEERFVAEGFGEGRHPVMRNAFLLVGPAQDPAGIRGMPDAAAALSQIARTRARFVSRGDDSGTHKRERTLWRSAGVRQAGDWYLEASQGMGKVLQMAAELNAYTLVDGGTWLAYRDKIPLRTLVQGDPQLNNPYSVIAVNPARHPHVNHAGAQALIQWLTSPKGQALIGGFTLHGAQAFAPTARGPISERD
jgi:tungstate transport system substrate-binding protein